MSITHGRGAGSLQWLAFLKYDNVQKWQSKFTSGLNAAKNTPYFKTFFWIKVGKHSISYQKVSGRICLLPLGGELGACKDWHFWNMTMYKNGKVNSLQGQTLPKIRLFQKFFWIKVLKNSILYQKISGHICQSSFRGELGASKDWHFRNMTMFQIGKVNSLQGRMLPKVRLISNIFKKESCCTFNFVPKSQWVHMSIIPGGELEPPKIGIFEILLCTKRLFCLLMK